MNPQIITLNLWYINAINKTDLRYKTMLQKTFFIILLSFMNLYSFSQVKIGQWVDHLSYNYANSVSKVGNVVYVSNGQGLAKYNTTDNSIEKMTKIEGLSDVGVQFLRKCDENNSLLVIYKNTNIDVISSNGSIINVSDIKRKSITGNKIINEVYFKGHFAYIACGFGIIVFDMEKLEIKDTYYLGTNLTNYNVYQVTTNDTAVFAATPAGVFYGKQTTNLSNYQNWKSLNTGIAPGPYNGIINFNNKIFACYSEKLNTNINGKDTIYQFDGVSWTVWPYVLGATVKKLYDYSKYNILLVQDIFGVADFEVTGINNNFINYYATNPYEFANINDVYYESKNQFWIADNTYGLIDSKGAYSSTKIILNGPASNFANDIAIKDGNIAMAPTNLGETYANTWNSTPPSLFQNDQWSSLSNLIPSNIQDINCVAIDPNNKNHIAFGCMSSGVVEITNNQLTSILSETNSPMIGYQGSGPLFVTGINFDKNSSLWSLVTGSPKLMQVRKKNNTWSLLDFSQTLASGTLSKIIFNKYNQAWTILARGGGLLVYSDVNGLSAPNPSNSKLVTSAKGQGFLPSLDIFSICEDLDGKIWVGTQKGITVFYNPENVFTSSNWDSQQILIEQDGHVAILLGDDKITAIAVDGANRKWIGTGSSGIYCLSPDGQTQIYHFTVDNSPLYSNSINGLAINETTGDVFIANDIGIQSYRTSLIKGFEDFSNIHAFPNPIRPGYSGPVYVTGLIDEAIVKISDVAGNLVWEAKSQGGQIEWNLQTNGGSRVSSGVYLVNCSSSNGEKSGTAKILVIN